MNVCTRIIIVLSFLFTCSTASAQPPGFHHLMKDDEMRELSDEAAALALIHNLSLSTEQREQIRGIAKPVRAEFEEMEEVEQGIRETIIKPRLRKVIEDLKAGKEPTPPADIKKDEIEALRGQMAALFVQADQAYEAVLALLSPEQQERLRNFRLEEYLGPIHAMHPRRLLHMEPVKMLQEIRNASPEEIDRLVQMMTERQGFRRSPPGSEKRHSLRNEKVRMLAEFIRKIHVMPQEEFEEKVQILQEEVEALKPRRGDSRKGRDRDRRDHGRDSRRGFGPKRIVLSEAFYEAL